MKSRDETLQDHHPSSIFLSLYDFILLRQFTHRPFSLDPTHVVHRAFHALVQSFIIYHFHDR